MAQRVKMLRAKEYGDKKYDADGFYVLENAVAAYLIKRGDADFVEEVSDKLLDHEKATAKMAEEDARHEKADKEKAEKAEKDKAEKEKADKAKVAHDDKTVPKK